MRRLRFLLPASPAPVIVPVGVISFAGALVLAAFSAGVEARGLQEALRTIPAFHYVVQVDPDSRIDWTGGVAFARARVRLPRIVYERADPEFGRTGTARSLTEARALARRQAREQAALRLMELTQGMQLDARYTLRQRMESDRLLRDRIGGLTERFQVRSRQTGEGYVAVELMLPFHGPEGLYALLARSTSGTRPPPEPGPLDVADEISGIIIDASELPDFRPSLEMRIFSDSGRMIYGPEIASRNCAVRRGMAAYYRDAARARRSAALSGLYVGFQRSRSLRPAGFDE